jgi:hypothetical protein
LFARFSSGGWWEGGPGWLGGGVKGGNT